MSNESFEVDSFLPESEEFSKKATAFLEFVGKMEKQREKIEKLKLGTLEKERLENESPKAHSLFVNNNETTI